MTIAAGIIERYRRYGWSKPPGEWAEIQGDAREVFRNILEAGDEAALEELLGGMFQCEVTYGLVSINMGATQTPEFAAKFTALVRNNIVLWATHTDGQLSDLPRLHAPPFGAPLVIELPDGVQVMADTPRHDHYAQRIVKLLPDGGTVLEIGGGYGGTALQILRASDDIRVVLCDLPETLYLAWWWLTNATDRTIAWHDDDPFADVVLLPAHEIEGWYAADVVFAAHSLSEMTPAVVEDYMAWWPKLLPKYFYIDQARMMVSQPDDDELAYKTYPEVLADQMVPGDGYRELWRAPTLWKMTAGRYWEYLYEREDK